MISGAPFRRAFRVFEMKILGFFVLIVGQDAEGDDLTLVLFACNSAIYGRLSCEAQGQNGSYQHFNNIFLCVWVLRMLKMLYLCNNPKYHNHEATRTVVRYICYCSVGPAFFWPDYVALYYRCNKTQGFCCPTKPRRLWCRNTSGSLQITPYRPTRIQRSGSSLCVR